MVGKWDLAPTEAAPEDGEVKNAKVRKLGAAKAKAGAEVATGARASGEPSESRDRPNIRDKGLKSLITGLCKLSLQTRQMVDWHEAAIVDTFHIGSETVLAKQLRQKGTEYADTCKQTGKGHGMGPPTPYLWSTLVNTLAEQDVGLKNQQLLKGHSKQLDNMEGGEIMLGVRMVRVGKTFQNDTKGLSIALLDIPLPEVEGLGDGAVAPQRLGEVRSAVAAALEQVGAEKKVGKAPAGALEREVGEYLRLLQD